MSDIQLIEFPENNVIYGDVKPFTSRGVALFTKWLADNNICYYGRDKENFFMSEAYAIAEKEGKAKLLVENFS